MPGSTEAMDPKPDHGEETYKGSGRMQDFGTIVTGGDSGIAAPSRSPSPARARTC